MDLAAESRSGVRGTARPDASEFDAPPRSDAQGHGRAEAEPDMPGGPAAQPDVQEGMQREEHGKRTQPLFPIPDDAVRLVALSDELQCAPTTRKYREEFALGMAACQKELASHISPGISRATGAGAWLHEDMPADADFAACLDRQKELFNYKKTKIGSAADAEATHPPSAPARKVTRRKMPG